MNSVTEEELNKLLQLGRLCPNLRVRTSKVVPGSTVKPDSEAFTIFSNDNEGWFAGCGPSLSDAMTDFINSTRLNRTLTWSWKDCERHNEIMIRCLTPGMGGHTFIVRGVDREGKLYCHECGDGPNGMDSPWYRNHRLVASIKWTGGEQISIDSLMRSPEPIRDFAAHR